MNIASIAIAGRRIGLGEPCFIIAEAGVNHNGDPELARELVKVAAKAGADAVKFQTFRAKDLVSPQAAKAEYQLATTGIGTQLDMLAALELSEDAHRRLIKECHDHRILFLSSPFDDESADMLERLGVAAFKVGSGELTNHPLLARLAAKRKPVILSTGMASLDEVTAAVDAFREAEGHQFALLHCVSAYPANPADVNLRAITTLQNKFPVPIGYSDHTLGNEVAFAAVAMGACIIEKHFTLDRTMVGPDHQASANPEELAELVRGIRKIEAALGNGQKVPAMAEQDVAKVARKSLVYTHSLPAGTVIRPNHLTALRPGDGIPPSDAPMVIGRTLSRAVKTYTKVKPDDLA
jgi:N-acetylneuraminate synthase/N,N'-diacetyllegionaminate synthase